MSAVVTVGAPRIATTDELTAPRRSRRLARFVFVYALVAGGITLARALRPETVFYHPGQTLMGLVVTLFNVTLAGLGLAVRSARLRFDKEGVHWGWGTWGFRLRAPRIGVIRQYQDAVAVVPRRGTTWYLSSRDWQPWDALGAAVRASGLPLESRPRRAPLWARLQGYGVALDLLLILALFTATAAVILIE